MSRLLLPPLSFVVVFPISFRVFELRSSSVHLAPLSWSNLLPLSTKQKSYNGKERGESKPTAILSAKHRNPSATKPIGIFFSKKWFGFLPTFGKNEDGNSTKPAQSQSKWQNTIAFNKRKK